MGWDADEARDAEELACPYERFELEIRMGNAAMLNPVDVADALRRVAAMTDAGGWEGSILDNNGNNAGEYRYVAVDRVALEQAETKGKEAYDWALHERDVVQHRAEQAERERDLAREELRILESSQIPVIPRGAQEKIERLEAELEQAEEKLDFGMDASQLATLVLRHREAEARLAKVPALVEAVENYLGNTGTLADLRVALSHYVQREEI